MHLNKNKLLHNIIHSPFKVNTVCLKKLHKLALISRSSVQLVKRIEMLVIGKILVEVFGRFGFLAHLFFVHSFFSPSFTYFTSSRKKKNVSDF